MNAQIGEILFDTFSLQIICRIGEKLCIPLGKALARSQGMIDFIAGPNLWREKATVRMILPFANQNLEGPLEKLYLDENMYVTKHFLKVSILYH